jgi:hypothetical protein
MASSERVKVRALAAKGDRAKREQMTINNTGAFFTRISSQTFYQTLYYLPLANRIQDLAKKIKHFWFYRQGEDILPDFVMWGVKPGVNQITSRHNYYIRSFAEVDEVYGEINKAGVILNAGMR